MYILMPGEFLSGRFFIDCILCTFTSRWTAPDPMGDAGGDEDWYGYCLDDPVNGVDKIGLMSRVPDFLIKKLITKGVNEGV